MNRGLWALNVECWILNVGRRTLDSPIAWHTFRSLPSREPAAARASTAPRPDNLKIEHTAKENDTQSTLPHRRIAAARLPLCLLAAPEQSEGGRGRGPGRDGLFSPMAAWTAFGWRRPNSPRGYAHLQLSTPIYTYLHQKPRLAPRTFQLPPAPASRKPAGTYGSLR